jgi:hypothetical protein
VRVVVLTRACRTLLCALFRVRAACCQGPDDIRLPLDDSRLPPSTPRLPPPRVHSCRSPSPARRTLNRHVPFTRVARAVRTRRRAFYAR